MSEEIKSTLEVQATVLGYMVREEGALRRSTFNKLMDNLGQDTVDKETFKDIVTEVKHGPSKVKDLYNKAYNGVITLDDITPSAGYAKVREKGLYDLVTPSVVDREAIKALTSQYKRAQRQGAAQEYLSQLIADRLSQVLTGEPILHVRDNTPASTSHKTMVISLSDWHIGARVDNVNGNRYNVEIAKKRLAEFVEKAKAQIVEVAPEEVYLIHQGDAIEHISMRSVNQAFDAEINATEQLAVATRLFVDTISEIASVANHVTVAGVGGNHDRFTDDKKSGIYGDNLMYSVMDTIILLNDHYIFGDNVDVIDNRHDIYRAEFSVYGKNIMIIHGDTLSGNDKPKIPVLLKNHPLDYVFFGHYHSSRMIQENGSAYSIMVGSLQGNNTYSKQLNLPDSQASQMITVFEEGSDSPTFQPIFFKD